MRLSARRRPAILHELRRCRLLTSLLLSTGAAFATAACWSLSADLDVSEGPSRAGNGVPDGGAATGDGGAGARDGGTRDGAGGTTTDGSTSTDGAGPTKLPDGGVLGFCEGAAADIQARICDDFDKGPIGAKWKFGSDGIDTSPGGTVSLGQSFYSSAPNAFVAKLVGDCPTDSFAQLIDEAPGRPNAATLEFTLSLAPLPASMTINLAGWYYPTGATPDHYRLDVAFQNGKLHAFGMDEVGGFKVLASSDLPFAPDTVHKMKIDASFQQAPRVTVKVDGTIHIDVTPVPEPYVPADTATTRLDFGVYTAAACAAPVEARFDDVLYRLTTY